jgi:hypothetical protein
MISHSIDPGVMEARFVAVHDYGLSHLFYQKLEQSLTKVNGSPNFWQGKYSFDNKASRGRKSLSSEESIKSA